MTDVVMEPCIHPGCDAVGVFEHREANGDLVRFCFVHDPSIGEPTDEELHAIEAEEPTWTEAVVSGLAGMILDHTAMSLDDDPDAVETAMRSLAAAAGMPVDFAAGIILATSTMASFAQWDAEQLSALADVFEEEAEEVDDDQAVTDGDVEVCRWCDSPDHLTDEHDALYPLPWGHDDPTDDPDVAAADVDDPTQDGDDPTDSDKGDDDDEDQ